MLKITNLVNGSVVNRNDGRETDEFLEINVEGLAENFTDNVIVNGKTATRSRYAFKAPVRLTEKFNEIKVSVKNISGEFQQSLKVVWDKKSFRRYDFFIDDNVFFLTDIAKGNFKSIFEHFYLKKLKELNKDYGTKFILNLFYRNDHSPFLIKDFPDKYKAEWQGNSDWLKLSFHAYSEFPDRPYQNATPEKLAADFDLVRDEIIRFAGAETFQPPVVVHWGMVTPDAFPVLKERGVKVLSGQFINAKTYVGEQDKSQPTTDVGYYKDIETASYLRENGVIYDFDNGLFFKKGNATCNLLTKDEIVRKLEQIASREIVGLATHEQYSFEYYHNYIADHFERMETAVRYLTEHDYKPVFSHEALLGNEAWNLK
ncbi:MAG: hypothetical protein A2017_08835 [Lentisphaerae bacterium GWF2_44_16]|nr:MAG: hypothetical protein A2017_08835 [Lentisphaerae bacterium GWF2_44_16]